MLAIAFLNPLLLTGLGLAALPVVIHLLSKRQFRRVEWAAMRFLIDAEKQNRRRVRFEQWLLLALRCLAMALLALLVARPFMRPNFVSSLLGGRGDVRRILVLDDSASLGYRGGASTDFATLRGATERLLDWLRQEAPADSVALYVTSQPDKPILEAAHLGETASEEWRSRLGKLRPTDAAAHPSAALGTIAASLAELRTPAELYLFSDFQKSDWFGSSPIAIEIDERRGPFQAGEPAGFEPLRANGDNLRVIFVSAANAQRENVGLQHLWFDRPQLIAGVPTTARVRVLNASRRTLRDLRLQIEVDGNPQLGGQIDAIEPGQSRETSLEFVFPEEGHRELIIRLATGDGLTADDVHRAGVEVKPRLSVLLVNGQPSSDPLRDEVQLPRNALAPPGPFSSGMAVEVIDAADLESTDLQRFDCVFLCNVAAPSESAASGLKRYVQAGGGLAIFLGEEAGDGVEFNRALGASGANLLPFQVDGPAAKSPKPGGAGLIRTGEHPITAAFPSGQDNLSEYVRFNSYYHLIETSADAAPQPKVETPGVLARFADGSQAAALVQKRFGLGRVLLFASTIDLDWNDWARAVDGSYVVTLLEIVQNLARRSANLDAIDAGNPVTLRVSPEEYDPRVVIRTPAYPDEQVIETRLIERAGGIGGAGDSGTTSRPALLEGLAEARGPKALVAGTYRFLLTRRAGGVEENRPVCVNTDSDETNLIAATPGELDAALGPIPHEFLQASDAFGTGQEPARRELWPTILTLVVLILMMEQALACWFGRPVGGSVRGRDRFVMTAR